jgi:hypothetical protein
MTPDQTPRCHRCGCPLEVCEEEVYCPCCTAFGIPDLGWLVDHDPDIARELEEWKADCYRKQP